MTSIQIAPATPIESATSDTFEVRDDSSANWVVRKIVEARSYAQHVKKWAESELRRAQREEQFFLQRYGHQLEDWARARISEDRRRKSIKLPGGTVGFRTEPTKVELKDDEKVIAWCRRSLPNALVIRTHIIRRVLTEHIKKTGECPEGADVAGGQQRFYISSKKSSNGSRSAR